MAKASGFRIAALGPFLAGVLSRVDGTLDADARVGFTRLDDDDDISARGLVNSLLAMQLLAFVEGEFSIVAERDEQQLVGGGNGHFFLLRL